MYHCVELLQAYNYHGDNILAADKCGEAIKCLQESIKRKFVFVFLWYVILCHQLCAVLLHFFRVGRGELGHRLHRRGRKPLEHFTLYDNR